MKPKPNPGTAMWQPIATAPKDGRHILLWWQGCQWPATGRWSFDGGKYGWRCEGDNCIPKNQHNCTHWMPLPEPPRGPTI